MFMDNFIKQQLLLDLFQAYFDARLNKRNTANVLAFEAGYEQKLFKLYEDIITRRYKVGKSICFIIKKPVKREIFAADFRDRIIHRLIFNYINSIFEKNFIYDSYSCRIGKGTSFGIKRVAHFIRSVSENYQKDCWILKLDIKGYFMAMDRKILYKKIVDRLNMVENANFDVSLILYLIREVIFNDPTKNCRVNGRRENWVGLPKSKSLFFAEKNKGFPIGNLTSQLFSNIYMDEFDHMVYKKLKIKHYGRYVDDMVFVHTDKELLKKVIIEIKNYLHIKLGLTLHPKKIYLQYYVKGVSFLGVFIKPYRIYIGSKTKHNFYVKMKEWRLPQNKEKIKPITSGVNSYLGLMKHYNTSRLRKQMLCNFQNEFLGIIKFDDYFQKVSKI
jgi:hypothetical protein